MIVMKVRDTHIQEEEVMDVQEETTMRVQEARITDKPAEAVMDVLAMIIMAVMAKMADKEEVMKDVWAQGGLHGVVNIPEVPDTVIVIVITITAILRNAVQDVKAIILLTKVTIPEEVIPVKIGTETKNKKKERIQSLFFFIQFDKKKSGKYPALVFTI
jgi:hypothetical protein